MFFGQDLFLQIVKEKVIHQFTSTDLKFAPPKSQFDGPAYAYVLVVAVKQSNEELASHADVLRLVTLSSPRTSAQRTGHIRSLAVSQS